jgi:hypothetical protein
VSAAPAPVVRDVLAGHLGTVRLPVRTAALLARADGRPGPPGSLAAGGSNPAGPQVTIDPDTIEEWVIGLVAGRLGSLLDALCDSTEQADIVARTRSLSGLGPGLTPTGDDLLVGIAAAGDRLAAVGCWPAQRRDAYVAALAGMGDTGTTAVAHAMVGQAAEGRYPVALSRFVGLLGDRAAGIDQLQDAAARLAAIGAHSGADMLAGAVALSSRICRKGEAG